MQKRRVIFWLTASVLYVAGCCWLYFGTLNFDNLDLVMSREDFNYMTQTHIAAFLGVTVTAIPVICLWLEFKVTRRFGSLRFWLRRYSWCLITAAMTAVFLWYRSHAAIEYPYRSNSFFTFLISLWCGLILNHCIMRANRVRLISR